MRKALFITVVSLILAGGSAGCTRGKGKTSKVAVSSGELAKALRSSKVGSMAATGSLSHIVINITGPDMSPIVYNWDGHRGGQVVAPPPSFEFDVPKGSGRMVQLLAVGEDANGADAFLYGDQARDLSQADERFEITVLPIGTGSGAEGHVAGRFLLPDGNSGPTGDLELMFTPPNGRPPMMIMDMPIINGWFNLFLVDGAAFSYRMKHNKEPIFSNIGITDPLFAPGPRVLHMIQPAGYGYYSGGTVEPRSEEHYVMGYFGPGAATVPRVACYNTSAGTVTNLYLDAAHTTAMNYSPTTTGTTYVRRMAVAGAATGGVAADTGLCVNGGTDWLTRMFMDGKNFGSGSNKAFGFESIFTIPGGQYDSIQTTYNSGTGIMTASWSYVTPDVIGANGVDGVAIFANTTGFDGEVGMGGDGVNCRALINDHETGFEYKTEIVGTGTTASFAVDSANAKVVACPFKFGYLGMGRYYFHGGRNNFHSGGGGGPATQIGLRHGPLVTNFYSCADVDVQLLDSTGSQAAAAATPITVDLAATGGVGANIQFRDGGCSNPTPVTSVTISSGSNSHRVGIYYNTSGTGTTYVTATSASPSLSAENGGAGALFTVAGSTEVTRMTIVGTGTISYISAIQLNHCSALQIKFGDASGSAENVPSMTTVNLSGSSGVSYYSNSSCTSSITSTAAAASTSTTSVFYTYISQSGWANLNAEVPTYAPSAGPSYSLTGMHGVPVGAPGTVITLAFNATGPFSSANCYPVTVTTVDVLGTAVNAPAGGVTPISLQVNGAGQFYSDNTCNTALSPLETSIAPANSVSPTFYYKSGVSSGSVSFTANYGSGSSGLYGVSGSYTLQP